VGGEGLTAPYNPLVPSNRQEFALETGPYSEPEAERQTSMDHPEADKRGLATADTRRVLELLPHRYPFLLVDRIVDMDRDESAVGIKSVTVNEPFFQGHFPGFPVMPGVLIIEGLAQTAGALCVHHLAATYKPQLVYFMGIDRAKFRKPVLPGDQLHYHVRKIRSRGRAWRFYGEAKVDGQVVAEAEVSAMIIDRDDVGKT
jgi:3-hydroxyacyl-[acyl-carrier-protein] dehydratase